MPNTDSEQPRHHVVDLKAGAHVMTLDAGVFCVFHAPGQVEAGLSGLPGVRISRAPGVSEDAIEIVTFTPDGWMGAANSAALVRVKRGPAGVMVTTYQDRAARSAGPRLQVIQLIGGVPAGEDLAQEAPVEASAQAAPEGAEQDDAGAQDVIAHIQRQGDVSSALGQWMGEPGSQRWIEGFSISPTRSISARDIEYQAVLGRDWLSPWSDGGQFCGSRGMSLPILGLRVRLKEAAARKWDLKLEASFTDGTKKRLESGEEEALQAESLAPLEAFRIAIEPAPRGKKKTSDGAPSPKDAADGASTGRGTVRARR